MLQTIALFFSTIVRNKNNRINLGNIVVNVSIFSVYHWLMHSTVATRLSELLLWLTKFFCVCVCVYSLESVSSVKKIYCAS